MASHNLDHQPQNQLVTKIADLEKQISQLRTLQAQGSSAINMAATGAYNSSFAGLADGGGVLFFFTLESASAKMIFSTFQFTLYQDSYTEANTIGHANLNAYNYRWTHWTDWQKMSDDFLTKGYKSVEYVYVENHSGATHDILMKGEWRYIVNGGSIVV